MSTAARETQSHAAAAPSVLLSAHELTQAAVGAQLVPLSADAGPPAVNSAAAALVTRSAEGDMEPVAGTYEAFSEAAGAAILAADEGTEAPPPWDSWVTASSLDGRAVDSCDYVPSPKQDCCAIHTHGSLVPL